MPRSSSDVHVIPNYSFQVAGFAGHGYICIGDSHRFVDPIFSFGLYVALRRRISPPTTWSISWTGPSERDRDNPFRDYMIDAEWGSTSSRT